MLEQTPGNEAYNPDQTENLIEQGAIVLDLRDKEAYSAGHIPNSIFLGAGCQVSTWASWVVPYESKLLLLCESDAEVEQYAKALIRVGLDEIAGFVKGGFQAWEAAGKAVASLPQISVEELKKQGLRILDVRNDNEWSEGHIEGAQHMMCGTLSGRCDAISDKKAPLAVICRSGYRSTIAASIMERCGFSEVLNVEGGMLAWEAASLPTLC